MDGICTLANDAVYDQLIALLNSIEVNAGAEMPVCVYPYDDRCDRIAAEIARRPNVQLYSDRASMKTWDQFARSVWDLHPTAQRQGYHRFGTHRRFCAFDAPFDRFLYMDADTLLLRSVAPIFQLLETQNWVVYDFQHHHPAHVYNLASGHFKQFSQQLKTEIFCSGFYASKRNLFTKERRDWLLSQLIDEAEILYPMAPDQTILNYMVMRSNIPVYNLAIELPEATRTGNCVTSRHFEERDHTLFDRGKPLTYLHYIGLPAQLFQRVCRGENIDFPYRNSFLYYRYLKERRPVFRQELQPYDKPSNRIDRLFRKLGFW